MTSLKIICGALVVKDNQFVMVQEAQSDIRGLWTIPAGHIDPEESIKTAAIREVKEETGLDIDIVDLIGVYQHKSTHGNNVIAFYFHATASGGVINKNNEEILDVKWITFKDFLELDDNLLRSKYLKKVVKDFINQGSAKNRIYCEWI